MQDVKFWCALVLINERTTQLYGSFIVTLWIVAARLKLNERTTQLYGSFILIIGHHNSWKRISHLAYVDKRNQERMRSKSCWLSFIIEMVMMWGCSLVISLFRRVEYFRYWCMKPLTVVVWSPWQYNIPSNCLKILYEVMEAAPRVLILLNL